MFGINKCVGCRDTVDCPSFFFPIALLTAAWFISFYCLISVYIIYILYII